MGSRTRALAPAVLAVALAGSALTACGGSAAPSSTGTATATANQAAATAEVTRVWETFFSKDTPISERETLLENGTTTLRPAVQDFASDPRVGQVTAKVQKVTFPSPTEADVVYQLSLNGAVVMSGMAGKAVFVNGHWLVSASTLCGLLQLAQQGSGSTAPIPGCS